MTECLKCGGVMAKHSALTFAGEVRDEAVTVVMPGLKCRKCGHQTLPGSEMADFMRLAADAYRARHNLLSSDEIRGRRNALGMTQEQFADWLPAGVASVRRWELGAVQDAAMDALLRLKTDPIEARETARATKQLLAHHASLAGAQRVIRLVREGPRSAAAKAGKMPAVSRARAKGRSAG